MDEGDTSDEGDEIEVEPEEPVRRDLIMSDAFLLGTYLTYLRIAGNNQYKLGDIDQGGILGALESTQSILVETRTAVNVAEQIHEFRSHLYHQYEGDSPNTRISDDLGDELHQKATTWFELLKEKIAKETRINIPSSGILDIELLMHQPSSMFEPEIWESMDETPKRDFTEACRSLSLQCNTASVMVALRAVEHYLRKWYSQEIGEEIERRSWGGVLDELIDEYVAEADQRGPVVQQLSSVPSVLSHILYLKDKRNTVNHPEESPTNYEAVITLFMVAGTIAEVSEEIDEPGDNE